MHRYTVLDATADGRLLALRDRDRRYHVARTSLPVPPLGTELLGVQAAALGPATMVAMPQGTSYRLTFEHIDFGQDATLVMMHPPAHWAGPVAMPSLT